MKADVSLEALWKPLQDTIHVYSIRVSPGVLEILLQSLSKWIWNLMKSDEFSDSEHLSVISGSSAVKPLNYRWDISKNTGVHERCEQFFNLEIWFFLL